jgi:hypothetical protein
MEVARRRFGIIGVGVLAFIILGYLFLRTMTRDFAEVLLERYLNVYIQIGHLKVSPIADTITVGDFQMGQPDGFGDEPMLAAAQIEIAGWMGLFSRDRHLAEIRIHGLHLNITTDRDKTTNLTYWFNSITGDSEESSDVKEKKGLFAIKIDRIGINPVHVVWRDFSVSEGGFEMTLDKGDFEVSDLVVGSHSDTPPGSARFYCEIVQAETENAKMTVAARFGQKVNGLPVIYGSA